MSAVEGKKFKVQIDKLKQSLDSLAVDDTSNRKVLLSRCYNLLLFSELCQRGAQFNPSLLVSDDSDNVNVDVLDEIQNAAGRSLLNESQLARPLIAASAFLSALAAEKLSDLLIQLYNTSISGDNNDNDNLIDIWFIKSESQITQQLQSVLQRCNDVSDERFPLLLNFLHEPTFQELFPSATCKDQDTRKKISSSSLLPFLIICILKISMGNYVRAASFSKPDVPKMYKFILDTSIKLQCFVLHIQEEQQNIQFKLNTECYRAYHTSDAVLPLTHLIRIAHSKDNTKRVSDLSLKLAESYLAKDVQDVSKFNFTSSESCKKLWGIVNSVFFPKGADVDATDLLGSDDSRLKKFSQAKQTLQEYIPGKSAERISDMLHHILSVRVEREYESAIIQILSRARYIAAQNRNVKIKEESLRSKVKQELLTQDIPQEEMDHYENSLEEYNDTRIDEVSLKLRDCLIDDVDPNDLNLKSVDQEMQNDASYLIIYQIERLILRAKTLSLNCYIQSKTKKKSSKKWDRKGADRAWEDVEKFVKPFVDIKLNYDTSKDTNGNNEVFNVASQASSVANWMLKKNLNIHLATKDIKADTHTIDTTNINSGMSYKIFLGAWSGLFVSPWSFHNITKAREVTNLARNCLSSNENEWGRKIDPLESLILDLGEADAESGILPGGFLEKARTLYSKALDEISKMNFGNKDKDGIDYGTSIKLLLKSHCLSGLVRIMLSQNESDPMVLEKIYEQAEADSKESLESLCSLQKTNCPTNLHYWTKSDSFQTALDFQICVTHQLVAESLIRSCKFREAEDFLKQAVLGSASNYDASFSLGAFWLRMSLYSNESQFNTPEAIKKAQVQLLKTAKLNTRKPDPFSLLGVWYEFHNDSKRAAGCYSKALLLDPSHPVAGRGIVRLRGQEEVSDICDKAIKLRSNTCGWAWKAIGDAKVINDASDEDAVLHYQNALRCRDIENPLQQTLGVFFTIPIKGSTKSNLECSNTWSALAGCYRRLGKYSASLRAYKSASGSGHGNCEYFCAWAQVELELGLLDDAAIRFEQVLMDTKNKYRYSASYGLASCKLLSASRNIGEGKFGAALIDLKRGVDSLSLFFNDGEEEVNFFCTMKLLGDLHSHGYGIPPTVFLTSEGLPTDDHGTENKLSFIKRGENMYKRLLQAVEAKTQTSNDNSLIAAALNDIGINILLQACVRNKILCGDSSRQDGKLESLLKESAEYFEKAIDLNQLDPLSWCGLGCALFSSDAILSQHAFCKALQVDRNCHEAWTNLALTYIDGEAKISHVEEVIDGLTQVADSPLMWIARGLLFEKKSTDTINCEAMLQNASDSYRASLQTNRHPVALLGLSMTCRRLDSRMYSLKSRDAYTLAATEIAIKESFANLKLFLDATSANDADGKILHDTMEMERGCHEDANTIITDDDMYHVGRMALHNAQRKIHENPDDGEGWLELAKMTIFLITEMKHQEPQSLSLAISAIERAKYIFNNNVLHAPMFKPNSSSGSYNRSVVSKPVPAEKLSEVHALSSWIKTLSPQDPASTICNHDLQRSLLLDPENMFARERFKE